MGASLLFLSSDTMAWRVRYAAGGQTIVAYKEFARRDRDRATPTGRFPDGGASLTGSAYEGCITPRLSVVWTAHATATTRGRRRPGLRPAWLFAHTGVHAGTEIPGIVGYELDMRTHATPRGARDGRRRVSRPCMSTEPGEPAPGLGREPRPDDALSRASGAIVFSSGTLGWELGLEPVPSASPEAPRAPDPRVVAMTRNLLARALRPGPGA